MSFLFTRAVDMASDEVADLRGLSVSRVLGLQSESSDGGGERDRSINQNRTEL